MVKELEREYGRLKGHYICARPGITGPWQVSGRSNVGYEERIALDASYVEQWKLARDIRILARTPIAVLARDGAY